VLEDHGDASHAGIHVTFVGPYAARAMVARVKACWASLWTERAWAYREHVGIEHEDAAMAVVLQRFVAGGRAGVAFSADPVTGDPVTVVEAARGTGEAVVAGAVTPDLYRVTMKGEHVAVVHPERSHLPPVLTEGEVRTLARLVTRVERALGAAVDVEWAYDGSTFWVVQARPTRRGEPRRDGTLWTRANLKEIFPDQPSPLAASYLSVALDRMFHEYNSAQGYDVPTSARLVAVFRGRPYLNLTLMNAMTLARGGSPDIVSRLFGGAAPPEMTRSATLGTVSRQPRVRLARELLTTLFLTPGRARRLFKEMHRRARRDAAVPLPRLDDRALTEHLCEFAGTLLHRSTLRRLHEIVSAQSRAYIMVERLLQAWIPTMPERLITQLTTGLGTLPNARLTYRLMALSAIARADRRVAAFLGRAHSGEALGGYRAALTGTRFLDEFDRLLEEFGHRAPFESDVMSARFAEDPEPLLGVIQAYLRVPQLESPERHEAARRRVRTMAKREARLTLRAGRPWWTFAWQWTALSIVLSALQRLIGHRDENRHVTTKLVAHLRRIALEIGRRAVRDQRLRVPDDVFFVLWDELPTVLAERERDWRPVIAERRRERARNATLIARDLLGGDDAAEERRRSADAATADDLVGLGVSPGTVTGTVSVIKSAADLRTLSGQIAVLAAIEPSLAAIFPLVSGLVAEIGGMLSHAAILAREYGLPAVVNVTDVTRRLRDGDRIELNGATGRIRLLGRDPGRDAARAAHDDERGDHEPDHRARDDV
jgi:pyruvate,water dikinase